MSFKVKYKCPVCNEYMYTSYCITKGMLQPVLECKKCGKVMPPYCGPSILENEVKL